MQTVLLLVSAQVDLLQKEMEMKKTVQFGHALVKSHKCRCLS